MEGKAAETKRAGNGSVLMLGMLMMAVFFSMAARAIFSPIMPSLQRDLDIGLAAAGSLFLNISVSYAAAMLLAGFLAARIGHGRTIVASLALISAGLLVAALASTLLLISAGMILIGAGAGIYPPSGLAMVNRKVSPRRRTLAFAFHEISPNISLVLAPLAVLAAEPLIGWRGVLMVMAAICGLAMLTFWRWGVAESGVGAAPNLGNISAILKLPETYVGMLVLSAAAAGQQGVYAILPAYLVEQTPRSLPDVNALLAASRVASVVFLLLAGLIVTLIGKRSTMFLALAFTAVCTALIGVLHGTPLDVAVVVQPALIGAMFPPLIAALADIGESRYQNITYSLIITVGITVGGGVVPALLGIFGEFGLGWLGFILIGAFMAAASTVLARTPGFGRD